MREVLATLMTLGEEIKSPKSGVDVGGATRKRGGAPNDWRAVGVGGICAKASGAQDDGEKGAMSTTTVPLSSGWLLVGDEVIVTSTGEEGIVVSVDGPAMRTVASSAVKNANGEESGNDSKAMDKNDSSSSDSKGDNDGDAMDVDTPPKNEEDKASAVASTEKHDLLVKPAAVSVKLSKSGLVQTFAPAEVDFNPEKLPALAHVSYSALAKRWENMIQTALANCVDHDALAMTGYIDSALVGVNPNDDAGAMKDDGSSSPKSVGQYDNERTLLPFGSGLVAAPDDLKNYPSVIPLDILDETVRKVVGI